jgi:hypothetical protein
VKAATSKEDGGGTTTARLPRFLALGALLPSLLLSHNALAVTPTLHTVVSGGVTFQHFEMALSHANTLLPDHPAIHREQLDETSDNFDYGQFEVFIPVRELTLPAMTCKSFWIVRMPMTLEKEKVADIKAKQALFFAIKKAVKSRSGAVRVVIETGDSGGCNLFFRDGPSARYIDYVGPIRRQRQ